MSTATMSYRAALDATDAAACLSRTLRDVLRAVVAVSMGPRALRGRAVAYSVLGYMARCSRSTVERAVAQLERLGLIRRGRNVDDARGGWGYEWHVDEAQLVALAPRDSYGEHAARQRARRATARPDGGGVDVHPCVKLTHTETSAEPYSLHPPPPRGLDSDPLDGLDEPPRAALWADATAPAPIGRGWASRAVAGAADAARALVAGLRAGPARAPSSSSPSPDGGGDKGKVSTDKAAPLVERIVAAHRGEHRADVEALLAQHGEAQLAAAWAYGEQHARLQPPRPAYLRAWLTNPTNAPSSSTSRPSSSPAAGPYSAAHEAFAPKEPTPEPTDEQRARNLAALDALDALLV
jgi:hypothetical protein